ncbi:alpha/beta fold hydrolase [Luteibacter sp. CQ10]|uniref:alpha/beta fold hydrolase n=1 Tax=Luteibacter sp. CQ10 TaxID=2805821 RepID=UPI0034A138DC
MRRIAGFVFALAAASAASAAPVPALAWGPCPAGWTGTPSSTLGDRLQCATVNAPYDHVQPDGRSMSVGVIRIRAALPFAREGAIFFHPGGPGAHPGKLLRNLAERWSSARLTDPVDGDKRRLAERFDLVAVIPRGLVGSEPLTCVPPLPHRFAFLPTHLDDENWARMMDEARATAAACMAQSREPFINTEQHVHDMDFVRDMLGDDTIHFYGISYGGMVGAWYASIYPQRIGRLLLDSSMDFTHGYAGALALARQARRRAFQDDVVTPLFNDLARHGLVGDRDTIAREIDDFPDLPRERWVRNIDTPAKLATALRVAQWWRQEPRPSHELMRRLVQRARFSNDPLIDSRMRWDASLLSEVLYVKPPVGAFPREGSSGDSVRTITSCNDQRWDRSERDIREAAKRIAATDLHANGSDIFEEAICSQWGGPTSRVPDLSPLKRAEPFLLIQSDKDVTTPLPGATSIVHGFPNARMLLVRSSTLHGVFNFTVSPCIERAAARYLLTGAMPTASSRVFACDSVVDNPFDALPGTPRPIVDPVPIGTPPKPTSPPHDEL